MGGPRIDNIFAASDVVGCVVESGKLVLVNFIVLNYKELGSISRVRDLWRSPVGVQI